MVLFAHCGSELIHDAAVDARVFVFRLLRDQGEVDFVIFHARVFGKRTAVETSIAAEEDKPLPKGTVQS